MLETKAATLSFGTSRRAVLVTLLIVVFSAGMITGAVGARALEEPIARVLRPASPTALAPSKGGVSDIRGAAPSAWLGSPWFRGVADRSMSAAARAAFFEEWVQSLPHETMSDAARGAWLDEWFLNVTNAGVTDAANGPTSRGEP